MTWMWAGATCRGTSHVRDGTVCQDTCRCIVVGEAHDVLVATVSDGAGSARFSKFGSVITCRTISEAARAHFAKSRCTPADEEAWEWVDLARDRLLIASEKLQVTRRELAATLIAVIATDADTLVLHVGDGAAVCKIDQKWLVPSWPAQGEYASTTFFITDDPAPDLRITRLPYTDAVAVFSDGLERLLLRFSDRTVAETFFDKQVTTVRTNSRPGQAQFVNASLRQFLDSTKINERTDDDKSLIVAVRR